MNANGESRLLPLSLGRRERGFTIKMSEHPSIHPPSSHSVSLYETLLGVPCQRIRNFVHAQEEFDIPQSTLNEWLPKDVGAAGDGKLDTDLAVVAVFAVLLLAVESHR